MIYEIFSSSQVKALVTKNRDNDDYFTIILNEKR